jgi:phenylpyruvate tautomerase PptA (4-oxalocrotonate tautomerase family)
MPTALIEVRKQYTEAQEVAIINAVHKAMFDALKLPDWDRTVRLVAHVPHRFACPPNKEKPDLYTLVGIDMFAGRSVDAKRNLYRAIVDNLASLDIPKDHVLIKLNEVAKENWGIQGGQPASEVDIGFKVEV